jgi:hypothetical protein
MRGLTQIMPRVFAAEILKERRFSTADMREDELRLVPNLWDVTEDTEDVPPGAAPSR